MEEKSSRLDPALTINLVLYVAVLLWTWKRALLASSRKNYNNEEDDTTATTTTRLMNQQEFEEANAFPRRVAIACGFRVAWLGFGVLGVWSEAGSKACRDPHLLVELLGFLSQLGFFSAFLGLLTLWWDAVRNDDQRIEWAHEPATARLLHQYYPSSMRSSTNRNEREPLLGTSTIQPLSSSSSFVSLWLLLLAPKTLQILFNFWVYLVVLSLFVVRFETCSVNARRLSDAQIVALAISSGIMGAGYVRVGGRLLFKVRRDPQIMHRVLAITIVCVVGFTLRCGLFLVHPLFDYQFTGLAGQVLYPWFFYTFPELVPTIVVLVSSRQAGISLDSSYANSLNSSPLPTYVVVMDESTTTAATATTSQTSPIIMTEN